MKIILRFQKLLAQFLTLEKYSITTLLFVIHQSVFRHLLIFRSRTAIVSIRIDGNTSTRSKDAGHFNIFRIHQADKIFHNDIHTIFMESALATETEEIKFQALAFHHLHIRKIADTYLSKIRLSGNGTKAGKLRTVKTHPVIIFGMLIIKSFQYFGSIILLVLCFSTQKGELIF